MPFYRTFQKLPPFSEFRGVSFSSCRYKLLNPAGAAVIKPQTVWARRRCSAESSQTRTCFAWFPSSQDSVIMPCVNKRPKAKPDEASAYVGSGRGVQPRVGRDRLNFGVCRERFPSACVTSWRLTSTGEEGLARFDGATAPDTQMRRFTPSSVRRIQFYLTCSLVPLLCALSNHTTCTTQDNCSD